MTNVIAFPVRGAFAIKVELAERAAHYEAMYRATGSPGCWELAKRLRKKAEAIG